MLAIIPRLPPSPVVRELDDPRTLQERGDFFVCSGRDRDALRDYSSALALDSRYAGGMLWLKRGDALFRMNDWQRAATSYQNAILQPVSGRSARAWRSLAATLDKLGRVDEAIAVLDEYLVRCGPSARWSQSDVDVERARLLVRVGRREEAARAFERATDSDPTHAIEAGDHFLFERGDAETAWQLYDTHPAAECDVALIARRAIVAFLVGDEHVAQGLWTTGLALDPGIGEFAAWWAVRCRSVQNAVRALSAEAFSEDELPTTRRMGSREVTSACEASGRPS